jgi:hypothetical protein
MTKIKTAVSVFFVGVMALAASESTKAGLIDRGNGLIYDNVLDVTWAQDIALSSTLGAPHIFNWYGAKAWVDQLVYRGYDDWRVAHSQAHQRRQVQSGFPLRWLSRLWIRHCSPWLGVCWLHRQ